MDIWSWIFGPRETEPDEPWNAPTTRAHFHSGAQLDPSQVEWLTGTNNPWRGFTDDRMSHAFYDPVSQGEYGRYANQYPYGQLWDDEYNNWLMRQPAGYSGPAPYESYRDR